MVMRGSNYNRYSIYCLKCGCLESRALRLRYARQIGRKHKKVCPNQITVVHYTAHHEDRGHVIESW